MEYQGLGAWLDPELKRKHSALQGALIFFFALGVGVAGLLALQRVVLPYIDRTMAVEQFQVRGNGV